MAGHKPVAALRSSKPSFLLPEPGGQVSGIHILPPHAGLSADHPLLLLGTACQRTQRSGEGLVAGNGVTHRPVTAASGSGTGSPRFKLQAGGEQSCFPPTARDRDIA